MPRGRSFWFDGLLHGCTIQMDYKEQLSILNGCHSWRCNSLKQRKDKTRCRQSSFRIQNTNINSYINSTPYPIIILNLKHGNFLRYPSQQNHFALMTRVAHYFPLTYQKHLEVQLIQGQTIHVLDDLIQILLVELVLQKQKVHDDLGCHNQPSVKFFNCETQVIHKVEDILSFNSYYKN